MPRFLVPAAVLVLAVGCGSDPTATVSGNVTLNGSPLGTGFISFASEDEQGGTAGGDIEAGRYRVTKLKPGKYRAHIAGRPPGPIIQPGSKEAMRQMSDQEIKAMIDPLPPDVTGNGQLVEIKSGEQTIDFKLESASRRPGRP